MKYLSLLSFVILLAVSCKPKNNEVKNAAKSDPAVAQSNEFQAYEDEIMKIHDDVMPKMSDINRLSTELRNIKTKTSGAGEETQSKIEGLDDSLNSLRNAEKLMMDWMKNYSDTKARLTPDIAKIFYERELEKITNVKMAMLNSIENANAWLNTHQELK